MAAIHTPSNASTSLKFLRSGAIAGAVSAFSFTVIHDIFISDIWMMFPIMLAAGAVCGTCVAWSYRLLVDRLSSGSWIGYNLLYVGLFGLLAAVSVAVFEPVSTVEALIEANEPAGELIAEAMPLTAGFIVTAAVLGTLLYRKGWQTFGPILLTCIVLVLLLGLNVSIIGLVAFPRSAYYLVVEMFGLISALALVYVLTFMVLEKDTFRH